MEKELRYNGATMHYTVSGEGSPVILMHGWGCNHTTVASIERICLPHHRVYNVDFPGFGSSTEPPADANVWGVEEYTQIIEQLAREEGIVDPILIGHSFGGRVAILFASRNKTSKVVLVDAAGVKPRMTLKKAWKIYTFKAAKALAKTLLPKAKAEQVIEKMRRKRGSADYGSASPMMRAVLSKVVNEDLCHVMPLISAPTLLIWGTNDTATPLADARKMERLIPDAGLVAFEGCGHYSFLDNPGAFAAVLDNFINKQ